MNQVLVLNLSYEPLNITSWRRAAVLMFKGKAESLEEDDKCKLRHGTMLPTVIRLRHFVKVPFQELAVTRRNVLQRDGHRCQYCGCKGEKLSIDHIFPRSRGGEDKWENVTTACLRCNAMKGNRIIGMIQPRKSELTVPPLYKVGCAGKIISFSETEDGRYLIVLSGTSRFKITKELETKKLYRKFRVDFKDFFYDLDEKNEEIKFSDLELIFKNLKSLFIKQGYKIDWNELKKQSLDQTINTLAMASPFSLEEKQVLLETINLNERKKKLEQILSTYNFDNFENKTIQ